jgi:hypothetical protein
MSIAKKASIEVQGTVVSIVSEKKTDFISLTDMLTAKDGDFFIPDRLRNRKTVEFLGIWESVHNPAFNYGEFAIIKSQAGLNIREFAGQCPANFPNPPRFARHCLSNPGSFPTLQFRLRCRQNPSCPKFAGHCPPNCPRLFLPSFFSVSLGASSRNSSVSTTRGNAPSSKMNALKATGLSASSSARSAASSTNAPASLSEKKPSSNAPGNRSRRRPSPTCCAIPTCWNSPVADAKLRNALAAEADRNEWVVEQLTARIQGVAAAREVEAGAIPVVGDTLVVELEVSLGVFIEQKLRLPFNFLN